MPTQINKFKILRNVLIATSALSVAIPAVIMSTAVEAHAAAAGGANPGASPNNLKTHLMRELSKISSQVNDPSSESDSETSDISDDELFSSLLPSTTPTPTASTPTSLTKTSTSSGSSTPLSPSPAAVASNPSISPKTTLESSKPPFSTSPATQNLIQAAQRSHSKKLNSAEEQAHDAEFGVVSNSSSVSQSSSADQPKPLPRKVNVSTSLASKLVKVHKAEGAGLQPKPSPTKNLVIPNGFEEKFSRVKKLGIDVPVNQAVAAPAADLPVAPVENIPPAPPLPAHSGQPNPAAASSAVNPAAQNQASNIPAAPPLPVLQGHIPPAPPLPAHSGQPNPAAKPIEVNPVDQGQVGNNTPPPPPIDFQFKAPNEAPPPLEEQKEESNVVEQFDLQGNLIGFRRLEASAEYSSDFDSLYSSDSEIEDSVPLGDIDDSQIDQQRVEKLRNYHIRNQLAQLPEQARNIISQLQNIIDNAENEESINAVIKTGTSKMKEIGEIIAKAKQHNINFDEDAFIQYLKGDLQQLEQNIELKLEEFKLAENNIHAQANESEANKYNIPEKNAEDKKLLQVEEEKSNVKEAEDLVEDEKNSAADSDSDSHATAVDALYNSVVNYYNENKNSENLYELVQEMLKNTSEEDKQLIKDSLKCITEKIVSEAPENVKNQLMKDATNDSTATYLPEEVKSVILKTINMETDVSKKAVEQNDLDPNMHETSNIIAKTILGHATDSVNTRFNDLSTKAQGLGAASGDEDMLYRNSVWLSGIYGISKQGSLKGASGYKGRVTGGTIGADIDVNESLLLGLAYSNAASKFNFKNDRVGDKTTAHSHILSVYSQLKFADNFIWSNIASVSRSDIKIINHRGKTNAVAYGKFKNEAFGFDTNLGYKITEGNTSFLPNIGLRYNIAKDGAYKQKGAGILNTPQESQKNESLTGSVGTKVTFKQELESGLTLTPNLNASVDFNLMNKVQKVRAKFEFANDMLDTKAATGIKAPKVAYNIGGGVVASKGNIEVSANYNFNVAKKYQAHQGSVKLKIMF